MAVRTVLVRLQADAAKYKSEMRESAAATRGLIAEMDKAAKAGKLDNVADQAGRMGLGFVAAVGLIENAAAKFEKQMSAVDSVTHETAAGMDRLASAALQAGKDTAFSATEAGQAEEELAKAGISTSEILGGALKGSLSLAAAGSLDLAESADIAAKTMNVFGLAGRDVGHIADVLASSANKSATDVHEMGEAIRMGGLAADAAGVSLEETVGTLSAFADRALVGSDAGTSLKTMLMMLQAPSDKAAETMDGLGISAYDAAGNFIGAAQLAGQLQKSLGGLTQEERNTALATIFGADAMRAGNVLYEIGEQGVKRYTDAVNDQGAAAETAALKTDNLVGDVERLTGSLETLAIESGSGVNQGLRLLAQAAEAVVEWMSQMPPVVSTSIVVLAGVVGVSLLLFSAFVKVRRAATEAAAELRAMGPAGAKAADGLERSRKAAIKAAAAYAALQIASELLHELGPAAANVDELTAALERMGKTGTVTGEVSRVLGGDLKDFGASVNAIQSDFFSLGKSVEDIVPFWKDAFGSFNGGRSFTRAQEDVKAVDDALTQLVVTGRRAEADKAFFRILQQTGVGYAQLTAALPQYTQATYDSKVATDGAGQAQKKAASDAALLAGGMKKAAQEGQTLIEVFNELHGAAMDSDKAMLDANEALAAVHDSFKENGKAISGNTDAALKNRIAVGAAAEKAAKAAQARYTETGSLVEANKVYQDYIGRLKESLAKEGLKPAVIQAIIDKYARMPPIVTTQVNIGGNWATKMAAIKNSLSGLAANVGIALNATTKHHRWGGIDYAMAGGGALQAHVQTQPTVLYGERETGGAEAYVPKVGNAAHSLSTLSTAAGWYGHTVVPTGQSGAWRPGPSSSGTGGGGTGRVDLHITLVDPMTRQTRSALITDALNRGKSQAEVRTAYP